MNWNYGFVLTTDLCLNSINYIISNCNQDVNQIEREIRSNGAFRSNRQFRSYISVSLCYDFRAIHISKS